MKLKEGNVTTQMQCILAIEEQVRRFGFNGRINHERQKIIGRHYGGGLGLHLEDQAVYDFTAVEHANDLVPWRPKCVQFAQL